MKLIISNVSGVPIYELKPGSLSDGTVTAYINTVSRIKKHPIGKRKLKTVTSDHLQSYMELPTICKAIWIC